ncbi:hypothetical protein [Phycisphaera mikurensis]|uniref:DUF2125 domain-containing protein n=1 Tax=Phycisphaera mikurensis (strain NBRC 102666 / KCTC 22515 / FYK2301M01) TaxID=1142394 RepID=I0IFL5_PHYMF|nr:hypothetical protein [Phycisphaera mikurensis]MBB6440555.1 hypothetical protein [Phycisphaera mikurensis]BAM04053.1 hypothetical protein PSMK_18940 [Phycisphaera mikurensis NBRC 102666]
MRTRLHALPLLAALALPAVTSAAAEGAADPVEPVWTVGLNMRRAMASPLASSLRLGMAANGDEAQIDELNETLGLDLAEDVGSIVLFGDDFESGVFSMVAELGESAGNLEGMMLAMPGYRSDELPGGGLLHHFTVNEGAGADEMPVWAAVPETAEGYRFVASTDEQNLRRLAGEASFEKRLAPGRLDGDRILSARIAKVPEDAVPEDTFGAAAIKSITSFQMDVTSGESLALDINLQTPDPTRAKQLQQFLQSMAGMGQMMLGSQPDSAEIAAMLAGIAIQPQPPAEDGSTVVNVNLGVEQDVVDRWMVENASKMPTGQGVAGSDAGVVTPAR